MIKFNKKIVNTSKDDILFIAVSMGEDSVALSHYLSQGFRRVCLIHINHGTDYSDGPQKAFEQYVPWLNSIRRYKHPVTGIVKTNPDKGSGLSESELRDIRYNLIYSAVNESGNKHTNEVVICHHLSDCVESYLMNCLNGVPEYMPIPLVTVRQNNFKVIRPFITTSKKSITSYVEKNNLQRWIVQDPSNEDTNYSRRNWLRHDIIPSIKKKYNGLETIVRKKVELIN